MLYEDWIIKAVLERTLWSVTTLHFMTSRFIINSTHYYMSTHIANYIAASVLTDACLFNEAYLVAGVDREQPHAALWDPGRTRSWCWEPAAPPTLPLSPRPDASTAAHRWTGRLLWSWGGSTLRRYPRPSVPTEKKVKNLAFKIGPFMKHSHCVFFFFLSFFLWNEKLCM